MSATQTYAVFIQDRSPRRAGGDAGPRRSWNLRIRAASALEAREKAVRKIWGSDAWSETSDDGFRRVFREIGSDTARRCYGEHLDMTVEAEE